MPRAGEPYCKAAQGKRRTKWRFQGTYAWLINHGRKEDPRSKQVQKVFLAIPAISTMTFLPALITTHLFQARVLCLLSMSSLMCTAYILLFIPKNNSDAANRNHTQEILQPALGPIRRYLGHLNGGLSMLILLNMFSLKGKRGVHEGFWLLCILPAGEQQSFLRRVLTKGSQLYFRLLWWRGTPCWMLISQS